MREDEIRLAFQRFPTSDFQRYENHTIKPPTYIKVNEFTSGFQEIVNTYGVPMYQEINPAVFAIVTFPFLFGVMFGDIGHGFLLLVLGIILCSMNSKLKNTSGEAFGMIRYLILLMGLFAFYNGLVYNEFFAIPTQLFGNSCYSSEVMVISIDNNPSLSKTDPRNPKDYGFARVDPQRPDNCVYPFGMDPRWFESDQFLSYSNNFKMKIAVIFAILQMSLGIVLKGCNSLYFRKYLDFFFEFIPQIILLLVLFGWMDALIIGKWCLPKYVDWNYPDTSDEFLNTHYSPPIITTMIDMFLAFGSNLDEKKQPRYYYVFND